MILRHRYRILLILALMMGGDWMLSWNVPAALADVPRHSSSPRRLSKKRYLRQIDQQLKEIELRIDKLRSRQSTLSGPEQDRLASNIRMLEEKLKEAQAFWKGMASSRRPWLEQKKELDAKVIRLQKSLTYVLNSLS